MRGSNTVQKKATHNYVIRSQFVGGTATFSDVQILDVHPGVRLNLTVFLARFPWTRRPDDFSDSNNMVVYPWVSTGYNVLYMDTSKPSPPAVYITSPIQVTGMSFNSNNMVVYPWASTGYNVLYMDTSKPSPPAVYITSPIQVTGMPHSGYRYTILTLIIWWCIPGLLQDIMSCT